MAVIEAVNVRELLLADSEFGSDEIEIVKKAVSGPQIADARQCLTELQQRLDGGDSSKRNRMAFGIGSYMLGRHQAAVRSLAEVKANGLADYYHARALMALQRYEDAADRYRQAADNGYDAVQCKLELAGAIRQAGRIEEAEQLLRETAREGATRAEYSYQMGCILADRGDTYGAIEYFERAADMDSQHAGALFRLAGQNNTLGNDDEAIRLYERCLSKPPVFLGALINLGLLYEDNEQYSAAAFCFRRVLEFDPANQRALLYLKDIEAATDMYYDEEAVRRSREVNHLLEVPITDFELTARSRNCLERAGIRSLGDLTRVTEDDLLASKNFGETSLEEVRELLETRGLRIGQALSRETPATPSTREDLSPQERALLETPVADLNLSVRARKCLSRLGITTVGELVAKSADELLAVRNFGVTSLNEIRAKLADAGTSLRND